MKKIIFFITVVAIIFNSCNAQKKGNKKNNDNVKNIPKTNIVVNKEYDDNGDLIKYDSVYTYYYSNIEGNPKLEDSILNKFKSTFNDKYFFSNEPFFDNLFFNDSLLIYDFYKEDFFTKRFYDNMQMMEQLFMQMDSVKNHFFYNNNLTRKIRDLII
jgi:hypothetical protein